MRVEMPRAFKTACRNLGQDLADSVGSKPGNDVITQLVNVALIGLDRDDARAIRQFIDSFLAKKPTPQMLAEFWWTTPAEIHFYDGDYVQRFLESLSERLGQAPFEN